jgi:hypothetical protein
MKAPAITLLATGILGIVVAVSLAADQSRVIALHWKVSPKTYAGACPVTLTFTGVVATDGPMVLTYTFLRSDGATYPTYTERFAGAQTRMVTTTWTLGDPKLPKFSGWLGFKVLSPVEDPKAAAKLENQSKTEGQFAVVCTNAPRGGGVTGAASRR